ncbi:hypothetical protein [Terrimonas alba]|uniref:hypothetical protein n=1 Tax=Terrimonas alba TaxID=3349636 RepID=UPI0035F30A48
MKHLSILLACVCLAASSIAQDFAKDMATAKSAYNAGKLEETHFALQQAMQEIDIIIGKEVLKLLPTKMDSLAVNTKDDNVSSNVGFVGATIHRSYGKFTKKADLSIISNSPMVAMLNSILNAPLLGGMMKDENSKTVKVHGYKARLERRPGSADDKYDYDLQVPLGSALITFTVDDCTDTEILAMANTLPLPEIAKLIQ